MTLQNRVQPDGEIVAAGWRGGWMGNRGILHDAAQRLGRARWRHKAWICCALSFKGRRRVVMAPGRYTELFFYDEAQALTAGHRPCAECRRADHLAFRAAWGRAFGAADAAAMDAALHAARVRRDRSQIRLRLPACDLPQGAMILQGVAPALIWQGLRVWTPQGYGPAQALPQGLVTVLTPAPILSVLAAGYTPAPHAGLVADGQSLAGPAQSGHTRPD